MKKKYLDFRAILLLCLLSSFSHIQAQTLCNTISSSQFPRGANVSATLNGVRVNRVINSSQLLFSNDVGFDNTNIACGYDPRTQAYPFIHSGGKTTRESITYTFDSPQTSVQVFLMTMGTNRFRTSIDQATFTINNGSNNLTISNNRSLNTTQFDCKNMVTISGNVVTSNNSSLNNPWYDVTHASVTVSSNTPFTSLTITDPRTG